MRLIAEFGILVNDDQVDATICPMMGVAGADETLLGEELARHVNDHGRPHRLRGPRLFSDIDGTL